MSICDFDRDKFNALERKRHWMYSMTGLAMLVGDAPWRIGESDDPLEDLIYDNRGRPIRCPKGTGEYLAALLDGAEDMQHPPIPGTKL